MAHKTKKEKAITDRFFLEEIIFRLKNRDMEYVETLLNDWMKEMIEENPLTQTKRRRMINSLFGRDTVGIQYFPTEAELKSHIGFVEKPKKSKNKK